MYKRLNALVSILFLVVLAATILSACGSGSAPATKISPTANASANSGLDGQTILQQSCSACHSLNRIMSAHHTAAEWQNTVNRMVNKGARLNSQGEQALIAYLAQNYK